MMGIIPLTLFITGISGCPGTTGAAQKKAMGFKWSIRNSGL